MAEFSTSEARGQLSVILNRAAFGKERVVLTRHGKPLAAVVPVEDLGLLEELEDRLDVEEAQRIEAEARAAGEKPVPLEEVKLQLNL